MKELLEQLKKLVIHKDYRKIKKLLEETDKYIKGKLFEEFLAMLFEGNGFIATIKGGAFDGGADILLSYPDNPNKIVWIVQAKNYINPLNNSDIIAELKKFEEKASEEYNCRQFMIISLNGYIESIRIFNKTNMSLENFKFVQVLIDNYSEEQNRDIVLPDLKPHNRYTYKEVKAILESEKRVAVSNATGTGKSFIILQMLFDYLGRKSILIAPSKEIITQLKNIAPWCVNSCRFYTYSKLAAMERSGKLNDINVDLILLDELHRAGAETWGKAVKKIIETNKEAAIIGFSATPIRFLDNNRDMVEELLEGNCATPLSLSDAIVRKVLPNPVYVSAIYNLDKEIKKRMDQMEEQILTKEDKKRYMKELEDYKKIWQKENNISDIIRKHLTYGANIKFIVFCENNVHLTKMIPMVKEWFKKAFPTCNKIKSYIITSQSNNINREINDFQQDNNKDEIKLLFAISKLNEGLHLKNISGIMMLRNTRSPVVYYQQLGRCLTSENVDNHPIIFDFVDNIDNLELINFKHDLMKSVEENNKYRVSLGLCEERINFALYEEHEDVISKFRNIEKKITYNWYDNFNNLVKFYEVNGHVEVPKDKTNERLYKWCTLQRSLYNKQVLNEEFVQCLEAIDFKWDLRLERWKDNLKAYHNILETQYHSKILYYDIINENYYLPIYQFEGLSLEEEKIIKWFYRQINIFKKNEMEENKKKIFISELRNIEKYEENQWLKSIWKIKSFYNFMLTEYNIDCNKFKIAPKKDELKEQICSVFNNKSIIENTIDKNLPKSSVKSIVNLKEKEEMYFVASFIEENMYLEGMEDYIDHLNYIYYKKLLEILNNVSP